MTPKGGDSMQNKKPAGLKREEVNTKTLGELIYDASEQMKSAVARSKDLLIAHAGKKALEEPYEGPYMYVVEALLLRLAKELKIEIMLGRE